MEMIGKDEFLETINRFISGRKAVYADLKEEKRLGEYFIASFLGTLIFSAVYGLVMGIYAGGIQILYDALKIPMLLLISLFVSLPTFYVLNAILGGEMTFRQVVVLFMISVTAMSTMLVAFMPVTLFFTITTPERGFASYTFTVMLNVLIFTLAGLTAVVYLLSGFGYIHGENKRWIPGVLIGSCVLAFVGTQLAWVLRPYFNLSLGFIRPPSGNFYVAILELLLRYL
ncbi:MAG: hypothetical protein KGY80_06145 [Candidatus Thorarchaeota archaeon]|nr:hypothetical protein [Candidatus Thorarchaeota archaeon]